MARKLLAGARLMTDDGAGAAARKVAAGQWPTRGAVGWHHGQPTAPDGRGAAGAAVGGGVGRGGGDRPAPRAYGAHAPGRGDSAAIWMNNQARRQAAGRHVMYFFWLYTTGCIRRGPELRPGPRGAALLWGLSPAGPSSSAPYPLEGPVRGLCPEPGLGKRRAGQLHRSTRLRAGSSGRGRSQPAPEQARRSRLRAHHARRAAVVAALARPAIPRRRRLTQRQCWIPTLGDCLACPR
jgi:hypothetical protein